MRSVRIYVSREPTRDASNELLALGSLTLSSTSIYHHISDFRELRKRAATVLSDLETGTLRVVESRAFALDAVRDAHALLESRTTIGKLYLSGEDLHPPT